MRTISNIWQTKPLVFWIFLVIALVIPSFTTLLRPGYFPMHDDLQVMRIFEMDNCFRDGQIPCRWVSDMGYGYGYPLFNYYPVMPYYLGELIHKLGFSLIWSVKITFILSFLTAGVTMFILAKKLWGNLGGLASALLYVYTPYHAVDVYVRGAMAESWSLAWAPAIFWAITELIEKKTIKQVMLLAAFTALFLTSHNPMVLIFTPLMTIWAAAYIVKQKKYQSILPVMVGAVWGLGLAAFFTLPVLLEAKLVHIETLFIGYFNYLAHFISLRQMFISTFWGYGGSIWGPEDGMSFQIGWLNWGAVVLAFPLVLIYWFRDRWKALVLAFLIGSFWLAAFLMHPRSNPIWEKITILQNLQFPWRILAVTTFTSSLVAGSFLIENVRRYLRLILLGSLFLAIAILYQPYFKIEKQFLITDKEKLSGALWDLQRTAGIFDYLPKTAKAPPGSQAKDTVEVLEGGDSAKISDFARNTNSLNFKFDSSRSAQLRLPLIDFPNWQVFVDQKETRFDNKNDLGQPTFEVAAGEHNIKAKFTNTPIRAAANLISVVSFLALIYYGRIRNQK